MAASIDVRREGEPPGEPFAQQEPRAPAVAGVCDPGSGLTEAGYNNTHTADGLPALQARLDAIYTPLETAVEELHDRRLRFAGRTPGRDWLPADLPDHSRGCAFLSRFFATPNYETRRFLDLAAGCDLLPVIEEYHGDKFVAHNPIKRALARLGFHTGHDRHGRPLVEFASIMDWSQQGRPMCEVVTHWGQSLLDFHRELFAVALDGSARLLPSVTTTGFLPGESLTGRFALPATRKPRPFLYECAPQYTRAGGTPAAYYRAFLRVCVADGILFEDFLLDAKELPFTRDVVLPAFDAAFAETGLKPLIVRLTPPEEQSAPHWFWYPVELKALAQRERENESPLERTHQKT